MARGTIVVEVDRCKGCELCTSICPQNVLHMSRDRFNARGYRPVELIDPTGKCTGCEKLAVQLVHRGDLTGEHAHGTGGAAAVATAERQRFPLGLEAAEDVLPFRDLQSDHPLFLPPVHRDRKGSCHRMGLEPWG